MVPKLSVEGHLQLYRTKSYMKSLFLFFVYGEKYNSESMTVLSYQFHNIPIWLLENCVVYKSYAFHKSIKTVPTNSF